MARHEHISTARVPHKVTRDDVARQAGVSSATVSRAFNTPSLVAPEALDRVRDAARALGYVPDKNASSLRRAGTGTILFLERRTDSTGSGDRLYATFYADIINAVNDVVDHSMYRLAHMRYASDTELRHIASRPGADAIVCHGTLEPAQCTTLAHARIPFVECRQLEPSKYSHSVAFVDEHAGGRLAGEELARSGSVRPCHITGDLARVAVCQARWAGMREAFGGREIRLHDGALGIRGGWDSAQAILPEVRRGAIDGIFVVNDLTAVGVVQALLAAGVAIPGDVRVVAYDNLPFLDTLPVRLTTIDLNIAHAYRLGTQKLIQSIRSPAPFSLRVTPVLVRGGTTP